MPWEQSFWTDTVNTIQTSILTWLPAILGALLMFIYYHHVQPVMRSHLPFNKA